MTFALLIHPMTVNVVRSSSQVEPECIVIQDDPAEIEKKHKGYIVTY